MPKMTRRDFLLAAAASAGTLAADQVLTGCSLQEQPATAEVTRPVPTATQEPTPESLEPTSTPETLTTPTPTQPGAPELAVARGNDITQPEDLVRKAIAALGGMEQFVPKGARVIVKPNMCVAYHTYEYAATTNPWVVGAIVKMCLEAGASRVTVLDGPFGGSAEEAYQQSGIAEQVLAAGGEMLVMPVMKFVRTEIPNGIELKNCEIFDDVLKADALINVPIAKHHSLARLTLGMKNLMGVILNRSSLHRNLGQNLSDLASLIYPALTVVDAVRILMANGPTGGNLDDVMRLDTIIASPDIVAADSYAAGLFDLRPEELDYIVAGTAMGLGRSDLQNLKIEEISVGI